MHAHQWTVMFCSNTPLNRTVAFAELAPELQGRLGCGGPWAAGHRQRQQLRTHCRVCKKCSALGRCPQQVGFLALAAMQGLMLLQVAGGQDVFPGTSLERNLPLRSANRMARHATYELNHCYRDCDESSYLSCLGVACMDRMIWPRSQCSQVCVVCTAQACNSQVDLSCYPM